MTDFDGRRWFIAPGHGENGGADFEIDPATARYVSRLTALAYKNSHEVQADVYLLDGTTKVRISGPRLQLYYMEADG